MKLFLQLLGRILFAAGVGVLIGIVYMNRSYGNEPDPAVTCAALYAVLSEDERDNDIRQFLQEHYDFYAAMADNSIAITAAIPYVRKHLAEYTDNFIGCTNFKRVVDNRSEGI